MARYDKKPASIDTLRVSQRLRVTGPKSFSQGALYAPIDDPEPQAGARGPASGGEKFMWNGGNYVTGMTPGRPWRPIKAMGPKFTCFWKKTSTWFIRVGWQARHPPPIEPNQGHATSLRPR
jgi:hypothetical protein